MTRFDRRRPVTAKAMVWQRTDDGTWERYLTREQSPRGHMIDKLMVVQPHVPVCLACLSNNVALIASEQFEDGELICHECGVRYGFVM